MRTTAILITILIFVGVVSSRVSAQFIKTASIAHAPVHYAAVDRPGELYLIFKDGNIARYDINGKLQAKGSMPFLPEIFDPRDGSRLFAFDRDSRQYVFFSPTLAFRQSASRPDSAFAIDPVMTCSSGDRDLLILDSADGSIKKVDLKGNRLLFETTVNDSTNDFSSLVAMREYQNFIFMLDKTKGILIFNMLGKLLKTIPAEELTYFNFLGQELYYPQGKTLHFFDLFTTETRTIDLPYAAHFALVTDERLYLVNAGKTEVFSLKP